MWLDIVGPVNIILSHVIRGLQILSKEMTLTQSHAVSLSYSNDFSSVMLGETANNNNGNKLYYSLSL